MRLTRLRELIEGVKYSDDGMPEIEDTIALDMYIEELEAALNAIEDLLIKEK